VHDEGLIFAAICYIDQITPSALALHSACLPMESPVVESACDRSVSDKSDLAAVVEVLHEAPDIDLSFFTGAFLELAPCLSSVSAYSLYHLKSTFIELMSKAPVSAEQQVSAQDFLSKK
jgi:hypothetical protein